MYKYTVKIIADNIERTIVKNSTTIPEYHLEYFKNLFDQWYKSYQIISIDIKTITSLTEI
jgi:hypothetical protein